MHAGYVQHDHSRPFAPRPRLRAFLSVSPAVALALLLATPPVCAQDADRREAVGLAREGQYDPAIAALTELRRRYPADVATAADWP